MLRKIWERYIFFASLRTFFFFLFCFYIVYVIVDFSTQSVRFYSETTPRIFSLMIYYLYQFIKYLDVFFPLAFLFTIIKVFSDMNTKNELVALQTAGLSSKILTRPLFYFAILLTIGGYLNYEYCLPHSMEYITEFRKVHKKDAAKDKANRKIYVMPLKDESKLVFAKSDSEMKHLEDVYWIQSKDIWHLKTLDLSQDTPVATFIDQFRRNEDKHIVKFASHERLLIPEIQMIEDLKEYIIPIESRSISQLISQWWHEKFSSEDEKNDVLTHLNYRFANPFFSLLILLTCVPYTMRFSRHVPLFLISSSCLFAFVIFYTIVDAAFILAENQVFSPLMTIWTPFILGFFFSSWNFARQQ